jgi:N-formylglutamate deformylase
VNGRFRGGYITRHYGRPASGMHALQLEMAMRTYMRETASIPEFDDVFAQPARALLRTMTESALQWRPSRLS